MDRLGPVKDFYKSFGRVTFYLPSLQLSHSCSFSSSMYPGFQPFTVCTQLSIQPKIQGDLYAYFLEFFPCVVVSLCTLLYKFHPHHSHLNCSCCLHSFLRFLCSSWIYPPHTAVWKLSFDHGTHLIGFLSFRCYSPGLPVFLVKHLFHILCIVF